MKKFIITAIALAFLLCVAEEKPLARVGIITDTHVTYQPSSCASLKKAMQLFKKHNVSLIINCGDVADKYNEQAYKNYRDTVKSVYPDHKPKELFSFANHDRIGVGSYEKAWPLVKKHLEIEHEPYSKHYLAGFIFLTSPQNVKWKIYEKMISDACKETPGKPVFLVDHVPACKTTSNTSTWGNGGSRRILNKYPQIVQLTGHVHGTFRNELNIWQGEFTVVNAGCASQYWAGALLGTSPERRRADEALIMELYKNKLVFRRFDLAKNIEYKPESPWVVPIPFDPATAPYSERERRKQAAPEFDKGTKITVKPDKTPCSNIEFSFKEPSRGDGVFIYRLTLSEKNAKGKWEDFTNLEFYGGFLKDKKDRGICRNRISAGFFDPGKTYRATIAPTNFGGVAGKALTVEFVMPEKVKSQVVYETCDPMKDCPFMSGLEGGKALKIKDGFYQNDSWNSRLIFPDGVWDGPAKTLFRFTVDLEMIQPAKDRHWTIVLRNPKPLSNANARMVTPLGRSGKQRYVIEFRKQRDFFNYYLLIREGRPGLIRFNYVRIEKLI